MNVDFYKNAVELLQFGFHVFPLSPGSKVPLKGTSGVKEATRDVDQIARWAERTPNANVGIHCGINSDVIVLDIDPRNGGIVSRDELEGAGLCLGVSASAYTGNGGLHYFFRFPHTLRLRNSAGRLCDGWDIKTTGGYVVGPGSWIEGSTSKSRGRYGWIVPPWVCRPQRLPEWLYLALWNSETAESAGDIQEFSEDPERWFSGVRARSSPGKMGEPIGNMNSFEGLERAVKSAPKGARNNTLNWAAYHAMKLVSHGVISASSAASRLEAAAIDAGLAKEDGVKSIRATIRSGMTKASGEKKT